MRRRLSIRCAVLLAALAMVGSSGSALASPNGGQASSDAGASQQAATSPSITGHKPTKESVGNRGSVDARALARQSPTKRPVSKLPNLGKGSPAKTTVPAAPGTQTVVAPLPTQATLNADGPAAQTGFDGLARTTGPSTNVEPPDPWVAVGPDHVVQVVNLQMRITDRQGGNAIDVPLPDFFLLPTAVDTFDSDGRVIYDSLHGRWLATEVSWDCDTSAGASFGNGYVDFAISETADPTGDWEVHFFSYEDKLPDFPAPGTSTDKVGFASNMFSMLGGGTCVDNASYFAGHISVMDWSDLTNGGSVNSVAADLNVFTPRFAVQVPATSSTLQAVSVAATTDGVEYFSLTGTVAGANVTIARADLLTDLGVVDKFRDPPAPQQPGPDTVTTAIDLRPTDAIWQNNRFAFVSNYPCTPTGDSMNRVCVRVTELDTSAGTSAAPTLKQDFLVAENGKDSYMGGIGLSGNGALHVGWTRSSTTATEYPSSYTAHQALGDALNSLSAKELLAAGSAVYTGTRWGDFLGVAQDPQVPSQVWDGNQWSAGASWATTITPLRPAGTTYVPITPVRVLDTRPGGIGLSGKFTSKAARTWQVTGVGGIPAGAVAVTGNVTVTQQEAVGYVAVTPTATNSPPSSTINIPLNDNRANNLTVPLSSTGTLSATYVASTGKKTHLIFDVTGYFLADDTGATFTPLAPVRVLDTRPGPGQVGLAGTFANNVPRTLTIAGTNAIPGTATAITGNLTVTQQSAAGYLAITKDPTADPATSTLNFPVSDNRANGVFAPLDGSGALSIVYKATAGAHTQVILDVTGYFEPGTAGLRFVPLNPGRIMDTRPGAVLSLKTGVFHAGAARALDVAGHWGVPVGAQAFTGNLTVTAQTGVGYIAVSPAAPPPVPATSTLNFPLGDNRANGLVSQLGTGPSLGQTWLVYIGATGKTHPAHPRPVGLLRIGPAGSPTARPAAP